jgi:hypothetical protein
LGHCYRCGGRCSCGSIQAAVNGASAGEAFKAAAIGGVTGGAMAFVGLGIVGFAGAAAGPWGTWGAVAVLTAGGGYSTAESFRSGQYVLGSVGAVFTALGLYGLAQGPQALHAGLTRGGNGAAGGDDLSDLPQLAGGTSDIEAQAIAQAQQHDLSFNGKMLTLYDQEGNVTGEWPAVSGREGFQDPKFQSVADKGPIPAGFYRAGQGSLQTRPTDLWQQFKGLLGGGTWPGGHRSWGDYRIWLHPIRGTNTFGRSGFSIHGGLLPGSAGCIDLCGGMPGFVSAFRATNRPLVLRVQY